MKTFRIAILLALAACVAAVVHRVGEVSANRKSLKELAEVSIYSVKPAIQIVELAKAKPESVPERMLLSAEASILMVATYSYPIDKSNVFGEHLSELPDEQKSTLCALAKNRELYRARQPDLFNEALMSQLGALHSELLKQITKSKKQGKQIECAV